MDANEVTEVVHLLWMHSLALRSLGWEHATLQYRIDTEGVRIDFSSPTPPAPVVVLDDDLHPVDQAAIVGELLFWEDELQTLPDATLHRILIDTRGPATIEALKSAGYEVAQG